MSASIEPASAMRIAVDGWKLALKAIVSLPGLFTSGLLVLVLWELLASRIGVGRLQNTDTSSVAFFRALPGQIVDTLVSASVAMAVHRFVVLDEIVDRPIWYVPHSFGKFAAWLFLFSVAMVLPNHAMHSVRLNGSHISKWMELIYTVLSIYVSLRLVLIFPAIATAPHHTDWRKAWDDARGHSWKIFWASLWAIFPFVLLVLALLVAMSALGKIYGLQTLRSSTNGSLVFYTLPGVLLASAIAAAVASRLFQLYSTSPRNRAERAIRR